MIRRILASGNTAIIDPTTNKTVTILRTRNPLEPTTVNHTHESHKCFYCNGTGLFYMGGGSVNGVYTGKTGPCFRCEGKGIETPADVKRNANYDRYYRKVHI